MHFVVKGLLRALQTLCTLVHRCGGPDRCGMHGSRQRLIDIGGVRLDNLTHDIASVGRIAHGYDTRLVPDEIAFRQQRKGLPARTRSEEHTSELQSLMRISYAVFCLTKNK